MVFVGDKAVKLHKKIIQIARGFVIAENTVGSQSIVHFAENMLEHFCVAEVKGFKLGKAELGKDIIGGISAWDYPVDIPYILFWIVFVGRFSGYEYGGIMWYGNGFILKDKRAAAFGAVEDLVIVIALGSYNVILTVMMTHILQI